MKLVATRPRLALADLADWRIDNGFPPLVIYMLLGRYFMRGLLAGSLKG